MRWLFVGLAGLIGLVGLVGVAGCAPTRRMSIDLPAVKTQVTTNPPPVFLDLTGQ